ncbi:MAG: ComF family protein [Leptolyngbyaceae cyanobacterium SM2_5_2]|nr:ComF family protein [Leptolyngbyaceae cyanobacterium SM2_5_2]
MGGTLWQWGKQQLLSVFLSGSCSLCQRSSPAALCGACLKQVRQCQLTNPVDEEYPDLVVISWGRYEDSLRQVIGRFKYQGQRDLAQWLGTELGQTWHHYQKTMAIKARSPMALVPIPLHPAKFQQRGFNQAELLAQWMNRRVQGVLIADGLQRVRATQAQHSLNRQQRQQNLAQAFQVNPQRLNRLRQTTVWLVDDIFTTGSTAQVAAQTLRRSGISVAGICTVARALSLDTDAR